MTREQIMVNLFEFSSPTYYKWTKHEKRRIFDLLNYAFTDEELAEFINTNKIKKIEDINVVSNFLDLTNEFYFKLSNIKDDDLAKRVIEEIKEVYTEKEKIDIALLVEKIYSINEESLFNDSTKDKYKVIELLNQYEIVLIYFIRE